MESTPEQSEPPPLTPTEFIRSCVRCTLLALIFVSGWLVYRWRFRGRSGLSRRARAGWLSGVAQKVARVVGLRLTVNGHVPESGLLIANHVGYLDVVVLSTVTRCLFVAKAEIADYPIFGEIGRWAGIVFIDRRYRSNVADVAAEMRELLTAGVPLALFPEGTTSSGDTVLPFKPSLFASVIESGCPVTPCAIKYSLPGGSVREEICYWGNHVIGPHLFHLLGKTDIGAALTFGEPVTPTGDRKELARDLHAELVRLRGGRIDIASAPV